MFRIVLVALVLLLAPLGWGAVYFGQKAVVSDLSSALAAGDAAGLAARADWPALRAFLKTDLAAQKNSPIGSAMGPPKDKIDPVIDYFVQPENAEILTYLHGELFPGVPLDSFIYKTGFAPPFGFSITFAPPVGEGKGKAAQAASMRERLKVRLVFRLDGLTWRAREMHVPLFMVPRHVYSTPAAQVYGDPKKRN